MKILFSAILCIQLGGLFTYVAEAQDSSKQIARFDSLLFRSKVSEAEQGFLSLLPVASKNNDEHLRLNCLTGLYRVAATRSQRSTADSLFTIMRNIFYDEGARFDAETRLKFYAVESQRLSNEGKLLESLKVIKRVESFIDSIKTDPSHSKELILYAKGTCLIRMSDYSNAESVFKNVLEICLNNIGDDHPYLTFVYNVLGIISKENLKFESAIEYYQEGFRMISRRPSTPKYHYISLTYNISNAYINIQEYDSALYYSRVSLKNEQALGQDATINKGRSYSQLARIFFELGQTDSAFQYIDKAIITFESLNYINLGIALQRAGYFYRKTGDYGKAEKMYLRALADFKHNLEGNSDRVRMLLNEICRFYLEAENFSGAHQYADSAISLSFGGIEKVHQFVRSPDDHADIPVDLIESLTIKAEICLAQGKSSGEDEFIAESHAFLDLATSIIDLKQKDIPIRESPFFYDLRKTMVEVRLNCYLQSGQTYLTDQDFIDLLSEMERIKADRHFYGLVRDHHTSFDDVSTSFITYEEEVKSQMVYLKNQLLQDGSIDKRQSDNLKSELFRLKQSYDSMENSIKHKVPDFYALKFGLAKGGLEKLFENWPKGLYRIYFFDAGENLYVFHLTRNKKKIRVIKDQESIKEFSKHAALPAGKNRDSKWGLAYRLYHELLDTTLTDGIKKIETTPDGPVWNVNFDLLLTERPKSNDFKNMPYLFKEYAINYTYSASLPLQDIVRRKDYKKNLLAFSFGETDKTFGDQLTLRSLASFKNELPGSRAEVRAISEEIDGDYFYGSYANEKQFKAVAHEYKVLHLALHGDTDDKKPENSRLYFYSEGNAAEDGMLHAFELYDMNLEAELAVLSACNTGSGEIVKGEGVMSLGRAFEYAGVNSLLLTRHEVSDAVTPEIMKVFYRELKNGKRKSEALQQAKLEFLKNAKGMPSDPYFWSSFYILGDDSPVVLENKFDYWKWILMAMVLVVAVFLFLRTKRVANI